MREDERRRARTPAVARDFLRSTTGWHAVGRGHGGTVAHRGVLHPDEYVDDLRVLIEAERHLGFTIADLWEVYRQGRKSAAQRALRARIDARLLEVANAGGNLTLLGQVMEVNPETFQRALARARTEQQKEAA
jgi:hypothetical protein